MIQRLLDKDEVEDVRLHAATYIWMLNFPPSSDSNSIGAALLSLARDPSENSKLRLQALTSLIEYVLRAAPDQIDMKRIRNSTIPWSIRTLNDSKEDKIFRKLAGTLLSLVGIALKPPDPESVTGLIDALKNEDKFVHVRAATILGLMGAAAKDAVPALDTVAQDPHEPEDARKAAAASLKQIEKSLDCR